MKLISMTDFVLEVKNNIENDWLDSDRVEELKKIIKYADFLKQPLKLELFIGEDAVFIFQWEFKEWDDSDMENQKIEDLLNDDLIYVLNDKVIKRIFD